MMLFPSQIIGKHLATLLPGDSVITSTVDTRIRNLPRAPQGSTFPICLFQTDFAKIDGAIGADVFEHIDMVEGRVHVRFLDKGESTRAIYAASVRQGELILNGEGHTVSYEGVNYYLTYRTNSQVLPTTLTEGVDFYCQLGTIYDYTIQRGE